MLIEIKAMFASLIIRTFQLVFSVRTVFFSHNKSARIVFWLVFSAKQKGLNDRRAGTQGTCMPIGNGAAERMQEQQARLHQHLQHHVSSDQINFQGCVLVRDPQDTPQGREKN